jgi:hypothetical protein
MNFPIYLSNRTAITEDEYRMWAIEVNERLEKAGDPMRLMMSVKLNDNGDAQYELPNGNIKIKKLDR